MFVVAGQAIVLAGLALLLVAPYDGLAVITYGTNAYEAYAEVGPLKVVGVDPVWVDLDDPDLSAEALETLNFDQVDYSDPTGHGVIPLVRVAGREERQLSNNLTVGDLAASDGAAYARISDELVGLLENIMGATDKPIFITSGYRHPTLNFDPRVGGAARSQHMAGRAADISSPRLSPLDLAEIVLDVTDCRVAVGLGEVFVHVDVRGRLASWAQEGAALDEVGFDMWVLERCEAYLEEQESEVVSLDELDLDEAIPEDEHIDVVQYADVLSAYARVQLRRNRKGAVLLDLRIDQSALNRDLEYLLSFLPENSEESRRFGVGTLIDACRDDRYFPYVVISQSGRPEVGIMSLAAAAADGREIK
jgi:hypothetical protein